MIHVIAILTAKPGQRDALLDAFRANVPLVLAEAGCIEYGAAVDAPGTEGSRGAFGPEVVVAIEKWESMESLKAHATAAHMVAYAAKTKELVDSRVIHVLSPA